MKNVPFLFSLKLEREMGAVIAYVLVTYLPIPDHMQLETKPTQQAVRLWDEKNFADFIICRAKLAR